MLDRPRIMASSSSWSSTATHFWRTLTQHAVPNLVFVCLLSCWLTADLTPAYQTWLRDPMRSRDLSRRSYYGAGMESPVGGSSAFINHHQQTSSVISSMSNGNGGNRVYQERRISCEKYKGVLISKQFKFCQNHPEFMKSVMLGEQEAVKECQHQFKTRRWNCSTLEESWISAFTRSNQQGMAEIAKMDLPIVLPSDIAHFNSSSNPTSAALKAASTSSVMQRDSAAMPADGNSLDSSYTSEKDFKKRRKTKARGRLGPLPIVPPGTREQAFVSAISSGGVAHAVTRACSSGMLPECGCDESLRGRSAEGFKWSGCSDNIGYGTMFSKTFVDAKDIRVSRRKRQKFAKELAESNGKRKRGTTPRMASVARALMNLHNNDAGREIIAQNMRIDCKCHGVSGSCEMKTCWRSMPTFREIGEVLKDKFDGATEVRAEMVGKKMSLVPRDQGFKPYGKSDLIYINRSPDFCELNLERGSLGTHGRQCNKTSKGIDGCDLLCCNRGYKTHKQRVVEQCNCEFKWCCEVRCEKCVRTVEIHTCK